MPAISRELSFPVKVLAYLVWIGAGCVFWRLGPAALGQSDPLMSIRLLAGMRALAGLPLLLILIGATAAAATVVLRRWYSDAGTLAAAVGLATLSVRGGTVEYLLIRQGGNSRGGAGFGATFAAELVLWAGALVVAMLVTARLWRARGSSGAEPWPDRQGGASASALPCGAELLSLVRRPGTDDPGLARRRHAAGIRHMGMSAVISGALVIVFSLDLSNRPVTHGQVLFICAASAWIAAYFAFKRFPVRSALWAVMAVLLIGMAGYLVAALGSGRADLPINLPHSPFLRPLPIQWASAAAGGALLGFWFVFDPAYLAMSEEVSGSAGVRGRGGNRK